MIIARMLVILTVISFAKPVLSDDTLATVIQRMQPESAIKIAYQETRYLELMEQPWKASGYLYALAPDVLIKEQQQPVREIMGANDDKMFYYDPVNDVRHHGLMTPDDPISLNVAAFKALVTGDRQLLEKMYQIAFSSESGQWTIILTGHENNEANIKVIITGLTGQKMHKITIHQPDGDRSELILSEPMRGEHLTELIQQLNQELLGE